MGNFKKNVIFRGIRSVICLVLIIAAQSTICGAQGIKVVKVEETHSGTDAFYAPNGRNGMPCGLVKLKSTFTDLSFRGQIVGNVDNKTNEYYIYMERGATQLIVSRPNVLPVKIDFPVYGIESIISKATYSIQIKDVKLNPKTNTISIDVKPRFANIFIDDIPITTEINDNGHYQILLPKGSHICRFEAEGYSPYVQGINIGKENTDLSVELESQLSDLDISCQTSSASIYINDSLRGIGSWKGKLPFGNYNIDIRKDGYIPYSQAITLDKKESRSITVPKLGKKKSKLLIETKPIDYHNAFIDGFKVDKFPIELEIGRHNIILHAFGCDTLKDNINVLDGVVNRFTYNLSFTNKYYERAYQGDIEILMALVENKKSYGKNKSDIQERNYWLSQIISKMDCINATFLSQTFGKDYYDGFGKVIGDVSYIGYKNYYVLFYLFESMGDYKNALTIIDKCGGLEKEFDGVFCYNVGEACLKTNREKDALMWFKRCINEVPDYVKEEVQSAIEKLDKIYK